MTYSSARFGWAESLEDAQRRKVALLLDRLDLKSGQRMLEIGCGWGAWRSRRRSAAPKSSGSLFDRAESLGGGEDRQGRAIRQDRNPAPGLS